MHGADSQAALGYGTYVAVGDATPIAMAKGMNSQSSVSIRQRTSILRWVALVQRSPSYVGARHKALTRVKARLNERGRHAGSKDLTAATVQQGLGVIQPTSLWTARAFAIVKSRWNSRRPASSVTSIRHSWLRLIRR